MSAAGARPSASAAVTDEWPLPERERLRSAAGRRDVAIAGIPRSGSTLACHLLNGFPDAVALHEPFSLARLRRWRGARIGSEQALLGIDGFFAAARASLRARGEVWTKHAGGVIPDNPIGDGERGSASLRTLVRRALRRVSDGRALRRGRVRRGLVRIGKPLSDDFLLCVKHPSIFTGLLPQLVDHYPCFATVRNPIAVLGSWNSIEFAVSEGRSRAAERLDPALRRVLDGCADRGERQLRLLEWYFERIARWLPSERILRYEDVVSSGGGVLSRIAGTPAPRTRPLESRNKSGEYDAELVLGLGERLLAAPGAWSALYPTAAIEQLLDEIERERWGSGSGQAAPSGSEPREAPAAAREALGRRGSA